jgi:hypothetical protein
MDPLTLLGGGFNLLGGIFGNSGFEQARGDITDLAQYNPMNAGTGAGNFQFGQGFGNFNENAQTQALRAAMNQSIAGGLGGGMLNDPRFQQAFQNNDIAGAMQQSNQANQMAAMPGVDPSVQNFFNLGQQLGQGLDPRSPQDMSGGVMGDMFQQGMANMFSAGDQEALYNRELNTMRQAAEPEMNRQFNKLQDRLFAQGRLGSTGGAENMRGLFEAQNQADLGFQQNAFNRAANQRDFMGQMGQSQIGLGSGLLGQNLGQHQNTIQNIMGANQLGSGALSQNFQNTLAGIGQQQSAGNQRLMNALNIFGVGQGAQQQGFGQAMQAGNQLNQMNQFGLTGLLGLLNAESGRIGATGQHAQALGQVGQNQGGFLGGIMGGIGDLFSDRRLKKNVKLVGTDEAGVNWYTWEWNSQAKLLGADKVAPFGVIAQEVREQGFDHAVTEDASGFLKVNYDMIGA